MKSKLQVAVSLLSAAIFFAGCAAVNVGGQVQAGRNALQTGRSEDAVVFLTSAAEADPGYRIPYRVGESVLTYLGRAYYETGQYKEARITLGQTLERNRDDQLARVYLGLSRLRDGESERGRREVEAGLTGVRQLLEYLAEGSISGPFWDPAGTLRADIATTLAASSNDSLLIASAERIGREFDEEIDQARRDEARARSRGSGGGE